MRDRSYWDDVAEAMELTIEGNRLIVGEIAACIRDEWHAAKRFLSASAHAALASRHQPRT